VQIVEADGQGELRRIAEHDERPQEVVPGTHEGEDRDDGEGPLHRRQRDRRNRCQAFAPSTKGSLLDLVRQVEEGVGISRTFMELTQAAAPPREGVVQAELTHGGETGR